MRAIMATDSSLTVTFSCSVWRAVWPLRLLRVAVYFLPKHPRIGSAVVSLAKRIAVWGTRVKVST